MKNWSREHPIKLSIGISLLSSAMYALFLQPIIDGIQQLKVLEITVGFTFPNSNPLSFKTNLISILFFIIVSIGLTISITYFNARNKTRKRIKNTLPEASYCDKCKDVESLTKQTSAKQKQYDDLLAQYHSDLPYKKLTDCLDNFFDNTEVLESLQLFSVPKLPTIEEANTMSVINIPLKFVSGMAKTSSNTNALFNINYTFEKSVYHNIKKLFDLRNNYYSTNNKQRDPNTEKDIQKGALELFNDIKNDLDSIKSAGDIKDTHYACYKLLEILANVVIGDKSIVNCDQLLKLNDIELQLKYGQRTGMLGAIFTENLYCFYNENSMTKKDRMYFSVPISYKQQQLILLGICNKNDLKVTTNCGYVRCCEQIYEAIKAALSQMRGVDNG